MQNFRSIGGVEDSTFNAKMQLWARFLIGKITYMLGLVLAGYEA